MSPGRIWLWMVAGVYGEEDNIFGIETVPQISSVAELLAVAR